MQWKTTKGRSYSAVLVTACNTRNSDSRAILLYDDYNSAGITFFARLNNPHSNGHEKISAFDCFQEIGAWRADRFTYVSGWCAARNLEHVTVSKCWKSKLRRFLTNLYFHFLLVYRHSQFYES